MGKIRTSREVTASDINCLENLVVAYNTVFLMSSIFIVIIAATTRDLFSDFNRILSPSLLLLIIGSFIVLVAGLGYFGVGKKSSSLMSMYTMLVIFIFVMEISAGLGILSFRREIRSIVSSKMQKALIAYPNDPITANLVDYIQLEVKCCGVNSFRDWNEILDHRYQTTCKINDFILPASCCTRASNQVHNSTSPTVHKYGCLPALNFMLHKSSLSLTVSVIAICTIQILGAYFSYSLATSLSKYKNQQTANSESLSPQYDVGTPVSYNDKKNYY